MLGFPLKSRDPKRSRSRIVATEEFNFPIDLLIEILKRLPLKSLLRFSRVCKSWLSLLSSPTFISAHVAYNFSNKKGNPNHHLFKETVNVHTETSNTNFSVYNTDSLLKNIEIECPVGKNHFTVCSRDGLVCLFDFYSRNPRTSPLVLWNPSIRKALVVPVPVDSVVDLTAGGFPKLIFGFGFDPLSIDYKVVRAAYFTGSSGEMVGTLFRADVYDLAVSRWRSLALAFIPHDFSTIRWRGVYLNGVIHWVCNVNGSYAESGCVHRSILTFKLGKEEFGEIKLPKELMDATNQTLRVETVPKTCKEVLGVIHNVVNVFSLWVMEEYGAKESWVKLFSINTESMVRNDMNVALLSGEVVVVKNLSGGWVSYDHKSKELKNLMAMSGRLDYVDTYVESLILLGHQDGVLSGKELHQQGLKIVKVSGRSRITKARAM